MVVSAVKHFSIRSSSMAPYFMKEDRVLAVHMKLAGPPKRGDTVFFKKDSSDFAVKRVIGLPGEHIEITQGKIYIDDRIIRDFVKGPMGLSDFGRISIPANHYFLMGDNRSVSEDSRDFGPVHINNILYKSHIVYWPIRHFKILI